MAGGVSAAALGGWTIGGGGSSGAGNNVWLDGTYKDRYTEQMSQGSKYTSGTTYTMFMPRAADNRATDIQLNVRNPLSPQVSASRRVWDLHVATNTDYADTDLPVEMHWKAGHRVYVITDQAGGVRLTVDPLMNKVHRELLDNMNVYTGICWDRGPSGPQKLDQAYLDRMDQGKVDSCCLRP